MRQRDYLHGGDSYRNQVEYDFSINTNPLGMPRESLLAAKEGVSRSTIYPDERGEELCTAIANKEGIAVDHVLLGNGAAELIYALCYSIRPKKGLVMAPTFQEYEEAILASGGEVAFWHLKEEETFQVQEGLLEHITDEIDILFLCNPNNPTGQLIDKQLLVKIAKKCEDTKTYFCLDECFLPFLEEEEQLSMKDSLISWKYLLVLRAFTKVYGMPGLRLGYAMSANEELLWKMRKAMPPWNTSIPAQMAGVKALMDTKYLQQTRKLIREERAYLLQELEGLTQKIYPSYANYLLFQSSPNLQEWLLEQKILIRDCSNYRTLNNGYFRIGIRTHEENEELIRRWKETTRWQNQL